MKNAIHVRVDNTDKDYDCYAMELFGFDKKMSEEEIIDWLMNRVNK